MKKFFTITILALAIAGIFIIPSIASSQTSEDFIRACYMLDAPFPPPNWDKQDLRFAALETLDLIDSGSVDESLRSFCLLAIGYAGDSADLPLLFSYKDDMRNTVIRSLKGFSHPDAITFLTGKLTAKQEDVRELAAMSLGAMDFSDMKDPMKWYSTVESALKKAVEIEKEKYLKDDILEILKNLKKPSVESK